MKADVLREFTFPVPAFFFRVCARRYIKGPHSTPVCILIYEVSFYVLHCNVIAFQALIIYKVFQISSSLPSPVPGLSFP